METIMEWNELRAFLAVAQAGSFSRAAEHLHVTQPAVSKRIQTLETGLGVRLFDRVGKRVHLTDAGRILEPRAKTLLADLRDTEVRLRNLHERVDGRLRLATSHHVGLHRLAPVLRAFSQQYPSVELEIEFVDSEDAHDRVAAGEVELAVVTLDPRGDPRIEARPLWHDPLDFVAAVDHPLVSRTHIELAELGAVAAILPGLGTYTGRIVAARFRESGVTLRTAMETNYLETIGMLVGIGLGWSVLPRTMVKPPLARLDVDCELLGRDLGCVTNPARTPSNAARAFVDVLASYADRALAK
jgi:DNA-binding transcriptional LysR family regulator